MTRKEDLRAIQVWYLEHADYTIELSEQILLKYHEMISLLNGFANRAEGWDIEIITHMFEQQSASVEEELGRDNVKNYTIEYIQDRYSKIRNNIIVQIGCALSQHY